MTKTIIKNYPKNITVTITYNNTPSQDGIKAYAQKLKNIIDSKMMSR
jgi:hypothetical protein